MKGDLPEAAIRLSKHLPVKTHPMKPALYIAPSHRGRKAKPVSAYSRRWAK